MTYARSPDGLARRPVTRALAVEAGVSDRELASPSWQPMTRGVHVPSEVERADPRVRSEAVAAILPVDAALGGWAAAHLLGVTDLDGLAFDGRTLLPVQVCLQPGTQMRRRRGIHPLRSALADADVVHVDGVPVTSPRRTAFDLMRSPALPAGRMNHARTLEEAVVGADAMMRSGLVHAGELQEYASHRPRWRGVPRVRRALELVDGRARSCQESRFRVLWMVDAGLPRPLVNQPLGNLSGELLGIPDLLDPGAGLIGEYDGGQHRELRQHTADNAREEEFEDHGLVVVRASSLDLTRFRSQTVRRLRTARLRGLSRDRRRDRWRMLLRD